MRKPQIKLQQQQQQKIKFNINENYISFFFSYVLPKSIFLTNFFSMHEFSFPLYPLYNE